jgi:hypothetical protein
MPKNNPKPSPQIAPRTVFYFQGPGLGIPGLPHQVSLAQADALGRRIDLEAAIMSGIYQSQEPAVSIETAEPEQEA